MLKRRVKELEPDTQTIDQPSMIDLGMGNTPFTRPEPDLHVAEKPLTPDLAENIAFNEEPVSIEIPASSDQHAPLFIEAWVNGKGIEQYLDGIGWVEVKFIPVDQVVTIKVKYLENLLRAKKMIPMTVPDIADGSEPKNLLRRSYSNAHAIRIIEFLGPIGKRRGRDWAEALKRLR